MLAIDTLHPVWVSPQEIREAGRVLKYRDRVVADKTRCINRARAALRGDGHNVPRTMDPWKWIEKYNVELSGGTEIILESCLRQREAFETEIAALAMELKRFAANSEKARQLMSLPGVGPIVSAAFVAYIGDPKRFKKAKQVVRYAGLDASVHQSGEEHWHGRISKNGPPLLRKLLVQAAHQVVRCNRGALADFYRRKGKEIGPRRAITALARKLLIAAWRLMQTDRLAYEVQDEKAMKGYRRSLRTLDREVAKAGGNVSGKGSSLDNTRRPVNDVEENEPANTRDMGEYPENQGFDGREMHMPPKQRTLSQSAVQAYYDRFGKKQDSQGFYEDPALDELVAHSGFQDAGSVFEFGCGTGKFAARLFAKHLPPSARYVGCDVSPVMTELARRRLKAHIARSEVVLSDGVVQFPVSDHSVDRVVSSYVLDLLSEEDIGRFFSEAHRVLVPGGKVCLASLARGASLPSRIVSTVWMTVFRMNPTIVGGCRPIPLDSFVDHRKWHIAHRRVVAPFGVPSEALVLEKKRGGKTRTAQQAYPADGMETDAPGEAHARRR